MFKMDYLQETGDIAGLIAVLRYADAPPSRRAQAAAMLGALEDTRLVEVLICAHLGDPHEVVRAAALEVLKDLAGADAQLAISSYHTAPGELDNWLVKAASETGVIALLRERQDITSEFMPEGEAAIRLFGDTESIVRVLRASGNLPEVRAQAALMLGRLRELEETETLVRALFEDPDESVRTAAQSALEELHGSRSSLVIQSYRSAQPYEDAWLLDMDALAEPHSVEMNEGFLSTLEGGEGFSGDPLNEIDFGGLVSILKRDAPTELRIKAVRLLQYNQDARAVEWLLLTALSDDDRLVRDAARQTLQEMFPENSEQMLQEFSAVYEMDEDEEEDDWDEADEEWGEDATGSYESERETRSRALLESQPSSIEPEKEVLPTVIGFLLFTLAVLAIIYFITR